LSQSLGSRTLSLSSSLKEMGMFGPLSPALSNKAQQQLLLSPTASMTAAAMAAGAQTPRQAAAAAAALVAAGGWGLQQEHHDLPMEEEMTADIFDLE
jgi:ribosomal protein L12E/L44/L45/RPP1/RPP2